MKIDFSEYIEKFTGKGKIYYYILVGILGVILIISGDNSDLKTENSTYTTSFLQEYKDKTEKELTDFLKNINGVGEVNVVISIESGHENIYAQKEKYINNIKKEYEADDYVNNSTYENEYIIIKNSGEEQALIEKTMQPEIRGVAVSCSGADDVSVVVAVTNTVSVVLDVPTHKICVTKMR